MKSILITGCNRGLGLGLVKNLLKSKHKPEKLIATYRDLSKSEVSSTKNKTLINRSHFKIISGVKGSPFPN